MSPQPWSGFKVSKHHYAMELARQGNQVVFLDPPSTQRDLRGIESATETFDGGSLEVIRYKTWFPYNIKFHARPLYDLAMRVQAQRILKYVGKSFSVVWDFDESYQFNSLRWFGKGTRIFHPVDQVTPGRSDTKNADVILSVAASIADRFKASAIPSLVVPHGLCREYEEYGRSTLSDIESGTSNTRLSERRLRVGYAGNLLAKAVDRPVFLELIANHPEVDFELFGPYESKEAQPALIQEWVAALKRYPNVHCHGLVHPQRIIELAPTIDMWLVCYDVSLDHNGGANSHKILEYLATGSPVVSNRISAYTDVDFVAMPSTSSNCDLLRIFREALGNSSHWSSGAKKKRIEFALKHTYRKHLKTIESFLSTSCNGQQPK
jgi:glycosyltransferase involved in cell wall biosynthesis